MHHWLHSLVDPITKIAIEAGHAILAFDPATVQTQIKTDASPVTAADLKSHEIISSALLALTPDIPVLSEESAIPPAQTAYPSEEPEWFWCIDPLDGTKGFLKELGEYSVNIALIYQGNPVLSVLRVPAFYKTYRAIFWDNHTHLSQYLHDYFPISNLLDRIPLPLHRPWLVASSGPILTPSLQFFMDHHWLGNRIYAHSALKFGWFAEGMADLLVRVRPTNAWDTAAGHCILRSIGGDIVDFQGFRLKYRFHGPSWLNPSFIAVGNSAMLNMLRFDLLPPPHQEARPIIR